MKGWRLWLLTLLYTGGIAVELLKIRAAIALYHEIRAGG